jgi:pyruvate/2-oxoglutarate dehydrogenase complex dihydrolipoamide acyltransferase (E2) component
MEIVTPKWGVTMDEARLVTWFKKVGDTIQIDEPVAEMETDKANADILSQVSGKIIELLVEEGDLLEAGQPIARVEGDGGGAS